MAEEYDYWSPYIYGHEERRMNTPVFVEGELGKVCTACGVAKPFSAFGRRASSADHLQYYCKDCLTNRYRKGHAKLHEVGGDAGVPMVSDATPASALAATTLPGPLVPLETWLLEPTTRPVSLFITPIYALVRLSIGGALTQYWLLRPQDSRHDEPASPVDEEWILALLDMLDSSPRGYVFGRRSQAQQRGGIVKLSPFWYELVLDLIAGSVFVWTYCYLRATRPRLAVATPASAAASAARDFTPIATPDAYPLHAWVSDADGPDTAADADAADAVRKVIHEPRRVPVRFTGELARLAASDRVALKVFCMECLEEVRTVFPEIEAVGLPLRCPRHRIKLDEWVRVGDVRLSLLRPMHHHVSPN